MATFRSLPWPIQLAAVCLVAAIGIALLVMAIEPRGHSTDQRQRHRARNGKRAASATKRMEPHERRMEPHEPDMGAPDKPPYQAPTPGLPPTAGQPAVRKLPGQDRLTRISRTGMDAQDRAWDEPASSISAAADDHLSGAASRLERVDPALAEAAPPPLRSSDPAPEHPQTAQMPSVRPPVPPPFPPPPSGETRAQRRIRLEALIEAEATERRRPQSP
jgi:hypothetical protein